MLSVCSVVFSARLRGLSNTSVPSSRFTCGQERRAQRKGSPQRAQSTQRTTRWKKNSPSAPSTSPTTNSHTTPSISLAFRAFHHELSSQCRPSYPNNFSMSSSSSSGCVSRTASMMFSVVIFSSITPWRESMILSTVSSERLRRVSLAL